MMQLGDEGEAGMRDFGRVLPQFWIGESGRLLRGHSEAQVIALYFITCPSANAIGLYYLPLPTLCHETGCPIKGVPKALRRVSESGLARYSEVHEAVWVPEMARIQIGPILKPGDKRIPWVIKEATSNRKSPFLLNFYEKYREPFHLPDEGPWKELRRPFEGASGSIPLEQDQDQEQERESGAVEDPTATPSPGGNGNKYSPGFELVWKAAPRPMRVGKGASYRVWRDKHLEPRSEEIADALRAWDDENRWRKDSRGEPCHPNMRTWLNQGRYDDAS
jgi:hypothetical protein